MQPKKQPGADLPTKKTKNELGVCFLFNHNFLDVLGLHSHWDVPLLLAQADPLEKKPLLAKAMELTVFPVAE